MKRYLLTHFLPFLVFIVFPLAFCWYLFQLTHIPGSDIIMPCKTPWSKRETFNYIGPSLTSSSADQVLCPGDAFGDLTNTYVTVKNCHLEMYHKQKLIWSSKPDMHSTEYTCAFALQRDGNAVLYRESVMYVSPRGQRVFVSPQWDSQTNFNPAKTELRVRDQQLQMVQTSKDGTERLFYVDAENREFREDMGEPKKVANKFILKKTQDEDKTILRINEYIGDLDGTHLILQTDCQLQLRNKSKTLWSIAPTFRHERKCALNTDEKNQVSLSKIISENYRRNSYIQRIVQFDDEYKSSEILENWIMFEDDQPVIIQTLKNGSEIAFTSGLGKNNGLKFKRKSRQLAEKTLEIPRDDYTFFTIERMDYIGNLTGLHLIFEQNCSLILANGKEKLWELQPGLHDSPLMDCLIRFDNYGKMTLETRYASFSGGSFYILTAEYDDKDRITGHQFALKNNQLIVTRQFFDTTSNTFIAGSNTHGALLKVISETSAMFGGAKEHVILPKGLIGDINGVNARFKDNCNWVLYNKTEMIWESGTSRKLFDRECALILNKDGSVVVAPPSAYRRKDYYWSTLHLTADPEKDVLKAKILVNNDGLWLTNTYADGTGKVFKALEGTNSFIYVSNEQ